MGKIFTARPSPFAAITPQHSFGNSRRPCSTISLKKTPSNSIIGPRSFSHAGRTNGASCRCKSYQGARLFRDSAGHGDPTRLAGDDLTDLGVRDAARVERRDEGIG